MIGDELEERLRTFSNGVVEIAQTLPPRPAANHFADQLLRSATSARANYAEARGSESTKDFIHKLSVALKELREVFVWLDGAKCARFIDQPKADELLDEADQLIAIFCASRTTAKRNEAKKRS